MKRSSNFFQGCLIGGAIGDALGRPVELLKLKEIKNRFGKQGITDLIVDKSGKAQITDDTQMTIFTAEGLLKAYVDKTNKGIINIPLAVYNSYKRWLYTQGQLNLNEYDKSILESWLLKVDELHAIRGPGKTCLEALRSGTMGQISKPINDSKGCGGVMRAAPVGLMFAKREAFKIGCEIAAITHGHPSGYISAGILAHTISCIIEGMEIVEAVEASMEQAVHYKGHEECTATVYRALEMLKKDFKTHEAIKNLGEGWVGDEALAIALYCSVKYSNDFKQAVTAAVNHDGDSDSTGAITGNIVGACYGIKAIPQEWIDKVELKEVLLELADDLLLKDQDSKKLLNKYLFS